MTALRAGLLGWPVRHSLSPVLHRAAAEATGVPLDYALHAVPAEALERAVAERVDAGDRGFNLTAPHKTAVRVLCSRLGPAARRCAAVNTVVVEDGALVGYNTDVAGFARQLGHAAPQPAVVIGNGGSARAVLTALDAAGLTDVHVLGRQAHRAAQLCESLGVGIPGALAEAPRFLKGAALVIACLARDAAPVVAGLPWTLTAPECRVIDLNYGAAAAPVLQAVRLAGRRAEDGLEMLAGQGLEAFSLWTGRSPPLAPVLAALRAAVERIDTPRELTVK